MLCFLVTALMVGSSFHLERLGFQMDLCEHFSPLNRAQRKGFVDNVIFINAIALTIMQQNSFTTKLILIDSHSICRLI